MSGCATGCDTTGCAAMARHGIRLDVWCNVVCKWLRWASVQRVTLHVWSAVGDSLALLVPTENAHCRCGILDIWPQLCCSYTRHCGSWCGMWLDGVCSGVGLVAWLLERSVLALWRFRR